MLFVPALVTLVLAVVTKRVGWALLGGCLGASWVVCEGSFSQGLIHFFHRFLETLQINGIDSWARLEESSNLLVYGFLLAMGVLIQLIEHSGSGLAYRRAVQKKVKSKKHVELAAAALSTTLAIDGYIISLTVGPVMGELFDRFQVGRVKLAYILDSLSAPLCSLVPFSSWIVPLFLQVGVAGIHPKQQATTLWIGEPLSVYFSMVPFIFYSLLTLGMVWMVLGTGWSYGAMRRLESAAEPVPSKGLQTSGECHLWDFFLPVILLIGLIGAGLLLTGGWFNGEKSLFEAVQGANPPYAIFGAMTLTCALYSLYLFARKKMEVQQMPRWIGRGIWMMLPTLFVINLAWTFGTMHVEDLHIGQELVRMLPKGVSVAYFPILFFLLATLVANLMGSSWATIALLFPVLTAMLAAFAGGQAPFPVESMPVLYPTLGAIVSGAVCGDHLSPLSGSSLLASKGAGCVHTDHVRSQLTYALPVVVAAGVAFLCTGFLIAYGFWISVFVPLLIGGSVCYGYVAIRSYLQKSPEPIFGSFTSLGCFPQAPYYE